ncbi:MAG: GntR family transcriptional regulator [Neisseriaceae bacterium]|nr:GntR family transcriptional regulator [Neisseriaceae bacterium]
MDHGHQVLVRLREMIASGEFKPGERIIEIPTAERLGVSRLPIRLALRILEQEGLLEKLPRRGFAVRKIGQQEILGAIEVRGVLEGLAARLVAQKGLSEEEATVLQDCVDEGDTLFAQAEFNLETVAQYHRLNVLFHQTIVKASGNVAIELALVKLNSLPFASVGSLVVDSLRLSSERARLHYAHLQHHALLQALRAGQSARAEALMKEHAHAPLLFNDLLRQFANHDAGLTVITEQP